MQPRHWMTPRTAMRTSRAWRSTPSPRTPTTCAPDARFAANDGHRMTAYLAKLIAGPVAFAIVIAMPVPASYQGHVALATFICAIVWWMTEPMPWAIAAMLPFLVFPAAGVMDIAATMRLYGQPIFFWIMGTALMGYA